MPHDSVLNTTGSIDDFSAISFVSKAQSGNQEAYTALYNHYFSDIFRFVYFRVNHKETAEDITEEVFISVFRNIASLDKQESFRSWLYQIARNRVIDHYRTKKQLVPLDEVENTLEYEESTIDSLSLEWQQKVFLEALKQLPPTQQALIKMKYFEELDNATIAAALGKKEGAIRVMQHRAITQLRSIIETIQPDEDNN